MKINCITYRHSTTGYLLKQGGTFFCWRDKESELLYFLQGAAHRPGHGQPGPDSPAQPDLTHGPGLGLIFRPDGRAGPGSGLPYLPFNEEARPVARGPLGFLTDGPGSGLIFRPDGQARLGPRFLRRALIGPARPNRWPSIAEHLQALGAGYPCII